MGEFDFDAEIDRGGTGAYKWDKYVGTEILPLWVADMDFASPPCVVEAIQNRVEHQVFGYTHATADQRQAVCDYLARDHQVDIDPESIVWLPGCVPALSMACATVGEPGDKVLTSTPVYPPFLHVHKDSSRELVNVPMVADERGRYELDFAGLEAAIDSSTRVFLLCNPHNPVGRVFTKEEVQRVVDLCNKHDLLLCSDEIHCDLVIDAAATPHVSALRMEGEIEERQITLMAASKTYNVAGLACAFAVIPNVRLRSRFRQAAGKMMPEISPLSLAATASAYREGESWRQELIAYLRQSRDRIFDFVSSECPQITMSPLEATYLAWFDVRRCGLEHPHRYFEEAGLGFSNGADFGSPGFVRMNFGTTHARIEEALQRLKRAVEKLR